MQWLPFGARATAAIIIWYGAHLIFAAGMKQCRPMADAVRLTTLQITVGATALGVAHDLGMLEPVSLRQRVSSRMMLQALLFLAGTLCTNASLVALAVSHALLIKASEPFFTLAIVWALGGSRPRAMQLFSLLVASVGLVLTSTAKASGRHGSAAEAGAIGSRSSLKVTTFGVDEQTIGTMLGLLSNLLLQLRNVLNKRLMDDIRSPDPRMNAPSHPIDILYVCFCLALPIQIAIDILFGALMPQPPTAISTAWLMMTPVAFVSYQLASMIVLDEVDPLTHAALNALKRGVVIGAAALLLHEPLSISYAVGSLSVLAGVWGLSPPTSRFPTSLRVVTLTIALLTCVSLIVPSNVSSTAHRLTTASTSPPSTTASSMLSPSAAKKVAQHKLHRQPSQTVSLPLADSSPSATTGTPASGERPGYTHVATLSEHHGVADQHPKRPIWIGRHIPKANGSAVHHRHGSLLSLT